MVRSKVRPSGGVIRQPVIAYVFGTRPNFVKMAPVLEQLRVQLPAARHIGVHTGQHYDREMSDVFFAELGYRHPITCSAWAPIRMGLRRRVRSSVSNA